jgi:CRISPR-associated protein Csx16
MQQQGIGWDVHMQHLTALDLIQSGDVIMGTLPINQAAAVCARGARYLHLSLEIPAHWRGRELSADEMQQAGAHLMPYAVAALV